jgi:hypothetical protein
MGAFAALPNLVVAAGSTRVLVRDVIVVGNAKIATNTTTALKGWSGQERNTGNDMMRNAIDDESRLLLLQLVVLPRSGRWQFEMQKRFDSRMMDLLQMLIRRQEVSL